MVTGLLVFDNLGSTVSIIATVDILSAHHFYLFNKQLVFSPHTMCQNSYEEPGT